MIFESSPWKCDLLRMKQEIIQYNNSKYFNDDSSDAITIIEQAIFYSAFVIRKLIDCKTKVSDKVDSYTFKLKSIPPKNKINFFYNITNSYNWDNSKSVTKPGAKICNWLIHSYVFFFGVNEENKIDSFYVSSDYDKNKYLYQVELYDWIKYMDFVGNDDIVNLVMKFDPQHEDYVHKIKETI